MGGHYGGGSNGNRYGGGNMPNRLGGVFRLATKMTWGVAVVGIGVLTLAAGIGFVLVDPLLNLLASLIGVAVTSGKDAATLFGAGDLAGIAIDAAKSTDLPSQILALLAVVLKPLIVIGWAIGVVLLLALPVIAGKLAEASRRYRG